MPKTRYILNGNPVLELTPEEHRQALDLIEELRKIYGANRGEISFHRLINFDEDEITITMSTKTHLFPDDSPMYS